MSENRFPKRNPKMSHFFPKKVPYKIKGIFRGLKVPFICLDIKKMRHGHGDISKCFYVYICISSLCSSPLCFTASKCKWPLLV